MKRNLLAAVLSGALVTAAGMYAQDRPAERQKAQQERIEQGVKSGDLTKKEAVKLETKEAKLHKNVKKHRKSGNGLTATEKAKIETKQEKLSKEIAKEKHDPQTTQKK